MKKIVFSILIITSVFLLCFTDGISKKSMKKYFTKSNKVQNEIKLQKDKIDMNKFYQKIEVPKTDYSNSVLYNPPEEWEKIIENIHNKIKPNYNTEIQKKSSDNKSVGLVSTSPSVNSTNLGASGTGGIPGTYSYFYLSYLDGSSINWKITTNNTSTDYDLYLYDLNLNLLASATGTTYPDTLKYSGYSGWVYLEVDYFGGPSSSEFYIGNMRNSTSSSSPTILAGLNGKPTASVTDGVESYNAYADSLPSQYYRDLFQSDFSDSILYLQINATLGDYDLYVYDSDGNYLTSAESTSYPDVTGGIQTTNYPLILRAVSYSGHNSEYRIDYFDADPIITIPQLIAESEEFISSSSQYVINQTNSYWSAIGVRPSNCDYDIEILSSDFGNIYSGSYYSGGVVDFVVGNFNYNSLGYYGIQCYEYTSGDAVIEYETGADVLDMNTTYSWSVDDVVEIYDLYLVAGNHSINMVTSLNMGIGIFEATTGEYWGDRGSMLSSSDDGVSGSESITSFYCSTEGWYGIILWSNDGVSGNYSFSFDGIENLKCNKIEKTDKIKLNINNKTIELFTSENLPVNYCIYDICGKLITSKLSAKSYTVIDISDFESGKYFLSVRSGDKIDTKPFLVLY